MSNVSANSAIDPSGASKSSAKSGSSRRSLIGAAYLSSQSLFLNALSVPALAFIIRRLGPAGWGEWSAASAIVAAVSCMASLGLRAVFVRDVARNRESAPILLSAQLGTRLVLASLATVIILTAVWSLRYPAVIVQCAIVGCAGMIITTVWSTMADLMQGMDRLPAMAAVSFTAGLGLTLVSVIVVWCGGGPVTLSLAYLIGPIVSLIAFIMILRGANIPIRLTIQPLQAGKLLWASRHVTTLQILAMAEIYAAGMILPKLVGPALFGVFAAGALVADRLMMVPDAIGTAIYPVLARAHQNKTGRYDLGAFKVAVAGIAACVLIAIVGTLGAGVIARVLMPHSAAMCAQIISITVWSLPLAAIHTSAGYALLAASHDRRQINVSLISCAISLPMGAFLIMKFGLIGAAAYIVGRNLVRALVTVPFLLSVYHRGTTRSDTPVPLQESVLA